jgi:hypothetical protein
MKKLLIIGALFSVLGSTVVSDAPPKDSEFIFARVQFTQREYRMYWLEEPWHHDYPFSDQFLDTMLREVTGLHVRPDAYRVVQLASPEIFKYPLLYISEPGFMRLTDQEIANLGEYIRRGGFIMCDDFRAAGFLPQDREELPILRYYLKRAVPERELVPLSIEHPIFNTFYNVRSLPVRPPYGDFTPEFWGMFDEHGVLQLIANYNNDLGEFWEWVDKGEKPFHDAATSVKLGINYVMYAMTH